LGRPSGRPFFFGAKLSRKQIVCDRFREVAHLDGDVIELGVAFGYTLFPLADLAHSKTVYACDTFDGLPYDDSIVSSQMCHKGEIRADSSGHYGDLFFRELPKHSNVVAVKGLVEQTLSTLDDKKFCFAWLDLDLYQPTSFSTKWLENRIVNGGVIGFHDYNFVRCPGIARVVDTELSKTFTLIFDRSSCVFFRKT
jgi:hypothetical protein